MFTVQGWLDCIRIHQQCVGYNSSVNFMQDWCFHARIMQAVCCLISFPSFMQDLYYLAYILHTHCLSLAYVDPCICSVSAYCSFQVGLSRVKLKNRSNSLGLGLKVHKFSMDAWEHACIGLNELHMASIWHFEAKCCCKSMKLQIYQVKVDLLEAQAQQTNLKTAIMSNIQNKICNCYKVKLCAFYPIYGCQM